MNGRMVTLKRWGIFLLLTFAVLLISARTEAANWVHIGSGGGVALYVDTVSISGGPEGPKEAWFMYRFDSPDCTSDYAKSRKKCVASDCYFERYFFNRTYCMHQSVHYFTDGTNSGIATAMSCELREVAPGTASELKWKRLYR